MPWAMAFHGACGPGATWLRRGSDIPEGFIRLGLKHLFEVAEQIAACLRAKAGQRAAPHGWRSAIARSCGRGRVAPRLSTTQRGSEAGTRFALRTS